MYATLSLRRILTLTTRYETAAGAARERGAAVSLAIGSERGGPLAAIPVRHRTMCDRVRYVFDDLVCHSKGLFLRRLNRREEAIESALLSIANYPWNWAAWTLLGECVDDGEEVRA